MPTVPVPQGQVEVQPLPNVRSDAVPSLEALGGGQASAQVSRAAQQLSETASNFLMSEYERAERAQFLQSDNMLSERQVRLQNDVTSRFRGGNAMGALEEAQKLWKEQVSEVVRQTPNFRIKNLVERSAAERWAVLNRAIDNYSTNEIQKFEDMQYKSTVDNAISEGATNPWDYGRVDELRARIQETISQRYKILGDITGETAARETAEAKSRLHRNGIVKLLGEGDQENAEKYYDRYAKELREGDYKYIGEILNGRKLLKGVQSSADSIQASTTSYGDQIAKAQDLKRKDPKLGKAVLEEIQLRHKRANDVKANLDGQNFEAAWGMLQQAPPNMSIQEALAKSPGLYEALASSPANLVKLKRMREEVRDDSVKWEEFLNLTPKQLAAMPRGQFLKKWRAELKGQHRTDADEMWENAQPKTQKAKKFDPAAYRHKGQVNAAMAAVDLTGPTGQPKTERERQQQQRRAAFREEADQAIRALENKLQREATPDEVDKILAPMIMKARFKVKVDAGFWSRDREEMAIDLSPEDRKKAYVEPDQLPALSQIPASTQQGFRNLAKTRGWPEPTEKQIREAYFYAKILGDGVRAERALGAKVGE